MSIQAWPFVEAQKIQERIRDVQKDCIVFATGYGPSGLPHIGTLAEVVRTTMVRTAFESLSDRPTRLLCFSDDMDGLRKVPENIPHPERLQPYLGQPLTSIPDPFDEYESFGAHNNARLCTFLDHFGFEYTFYSSTACYQSGLFNEALLDVLRHYDEILTMMLPTLGEERARSYSPFLPISPTTGRVLQTPVLDRDQGAGTIVFEDEDGQKKEIPVTSGFCKLQWKPDWAMRWHALQIDYEMSGKDLISSFDISTKICRILGSRPPEGFHYELFLDQDQRKISKSRGVGLSVETWLEYAPYESLALYMYNKPRSAKRLHFDIIPRTVDEYLTKVLQFHQYPVQEQQNHAVWYVHQGRVPHITCPLSYTLLLHLASVVNTESREVMWGFIRHYLPGSDAEGMPYLDRLVGYAIRYYQTFVKPYKRYRLPTREERPAFVALLQELDTLRNTHEDSETMAETVQNRLYVIGKTYSFTKLQHWFQSLYEVLLGQDSGPRMGSFIALYGIEETYRLVLGVLEKGEGR